MIHGERLRQARELRGLTQTELAERVGVTQPAIAQIERGSIQPSADVMARISFQTGFPLAFFRRPASVDFPLGSLLFRGHKTMLARQRTQARRFGEVTYEVAAAMAARVSRGPVRLPRLSGAERQDPQQAAILTRSALGLSPDTPIPTLINILERAGVLVIALPFEYGKQDAFSLWTGTDLQEPVIALMRGAPGDRLRYSVSHELGHLVMHQAPHAEVEREAEIFAAEFLLPETAMRNELAPPITLTDLAPLKPKWGVSIQALIMRARDLRLISDRQLRYLFQQLSRRGWKTREPSNLDIPIEKPRAVRKMAELLYGDPIDYKRLATDMGVWPSFVRELTDGHATRREMSPHSTSQTASIILADVGATVIDFPTRHSCTQ